MSNRWPWQGSRLPKPSAEGKAWWRPARAGPNNEGEGVGGLKLGELHLGGADHQGLGITGRDGGAEGVIFEAGIELQLAARFFEGFDDAVG